jgi:CHAT domain-containing protein
MKPVPARALTPPVKLEKTTPVQARLENDLKQTRQAIAAGKYETAASLCAAGYSESIRQGEIELAAKFLGNLGGIQYATLRFKEALESYQKAHSLVAKAANPNIAAALKANIASLYAQLGELDAAAEWLEASAAALTGKDGTKYIATIHPQLAAIRAHQGRPDLAIPLYTSGLRAAEEVGDWALYATIWNRIGEVYLKQKDLVNAEGPLLEAWRIRKLRRLPTESSLFNLARLEMGRGDHAKASWLLDRAVELVHQSRSTLPTWDLYHTRGRLRLEQGRPAEAMQDLRTALALARAWRWASPADEASRIGSEGPMVLQQVYAALIDAGNLLYVKTGDRKVLAETADAAEENRAASLRDLISDPARQRANLSPQFRQTLQQLQRAEVSAIQNPGPDAESVLQRLRAELVQMEAGFGPGSEPPERNVLEKTRAALDRDTAVLAFHLGPTRSWVWAIDREGVAVHALPAESRITPEVEALGKALQSSDPNWKEPAERLSRTLIGILGPRLHARRHWLVAPGAKLYEAPLGALIESHGAEPVPVAQNHSIQVIPNLSIVFDGRQRSLDSGRFVGLGDAVYNSADPRWRGGTPSLNLPRLVGSSAEIRECAKAWGRNDHVILTGADVSKPKLLEALALRPSVVHIAAHVVESTQKPAGGLITLSPDEQGRAEVLTQFEIARWRIETGLVVLSGCSSGRGAALPGTGLQGLTRAWLAAGAVNVIASQWATPDDSGVLFASFYRHLRTNAAANPAVALQRAQQDMMAAGGRSAHPRLWGAYFIVGSPLRKRGV